MTEQSRPAPVIAEGERAPATMGMDAAAGGDNGARLARNRPKAPKGRNWLGARMVLETLGLVAFVALVEWKLPRANAQALGFSLYWIPVVLASAQYGSRAGVLATLAATGASLGAHWPSRLAEQDYYDYVAFLAAQPAAWLVYSLVLGGLRDLHKAREIAAQEELAETRDSAELIGKGLERALNEIKMLEMRIAKDKATLDAFLRALGKFKVSSESEILPSFVELVREATAAEAVTLFMRQGDSFLVAARVSNMEGAPPATPPPESALPLMQATRRAVELECPADPAGAIQGACAAPICGDADSEIQGVVVISLAAKGDQLRQAMRRAERLGQLLGNLLDVLAPNRAERVV